MTLKEQQKATELWIKFLSGNEGAFAEFYCLFFDDLMHYGVRVGGDNEVVEDLIQDIFLKLYQKNIVLDDNSKLRPFLYRTLKNAIYNHLLREKRLSPLQDSDIVFTLDYTIDDQLFLSDKYNLAEEIENILHNLTERQKELIYLRFVHDMSFEEISEIMEINIQSARNLLFRSMSILRKEAHPHIFFLV